MGFGSLQHIQGSKIHFTRALPARYGPPSGFGYPLDGFRPSIPRRSCFVPAALLGFLPSEPSPPARYRAVSDADEPACCFSCRCSQALYHRSGEHRAGPTGRSFQALTLAGIPGEPDLVQIGTRWMLPWDSSLPGFFRRDLGHELSPRPPLTCLPARSTGSATWTNPTPVLGLHLRVSIGPGLARSVRNGQAAATRTRQPS